MADALMHRSVITYRAVIKYYFCLIWLYILLSALIAIAFTSFYGGFMLLEVGGLTFTRAWRRLVHGLRPAVATFMFIGLCFVGRSPGKLCYPAVLLG